MERRFTVNDTLTDILNQITIDLLPCAFSGCGQLAHPPTDHIYRPETDLYELGWDWEDDEEDDWDLR